jgi:hypothetical protein
MTTFDECQLTLQFRQISRFLTQLKLCIYHAPYRSNDLDGRSWKRVLSVPGATLSWNIKG